MIRWIRRDGIKTTRGETVPASIGDMLYLVTETGAMALTDGACYINGQPAEPGEYRVAFPDGVFVVKVGESVSWEVAAGA